MAPTAPAHRSMPDTVGTACCRHACLRRDLRVGWLATVCVSGSGGALRAQTTHQRALTSKVRRSCRPTESYEAVGALWSLLGGLSAAVCSALLNAPTGEWQRL